MTTTVLGIGAGLIVGGAVGALVGYICGYGEGYRSNDARPRAPFGVVSKRQSGPL